MSFAEAEGWRPLPDDTFVATLGAIHLRAREDGLEMGLVAGDRLVNLSGAVHGGALMTLIDRTCGMVARDAAGGDRIATASMTVNFLRSSAVGARVVVHGRLRKAGRKSYFTDAEAFADGRLVATATAVFMRVDKARQAAEA